MSSDDIVDRLRYRAKFGNPEWHKWCLKLADEAADEIERLRAEVKRLWTRIDSGQFPQEEPDER